MTTQAAAQVMIILSAAGLHPRQDYKIGPQFAVDPPLIFTLLRSLPDDVLEQICAIADVTIDG